MAESQKQVWLPLVEAENSEEPIEVETEADGRLLLDTVKAQFPGAIGIRFRNKETGALRGVRIQNNELFPPFDSGWGPGPYIVITPKTCSASSGSSTGSKRKTSKSLSDHDDALSTNTSSSSASLALSKTARLDAESVSRLSTPTTTTTDLIVLNLSFNTTECEVREFFSQFGALKMCQLKVKDGKSKGFAFIHFEDVDVQRKVMQQRHKVGERWCDVKVPNSQDKSGVKETDSAREYKICVRRLEDSISLDDLTKHFEAFGAITDVFYPKPSRGFAFVTFVEKPVARSLIGLEQTINGITISITEPSSKPRFDPNGVPVPTGQQQSQAQVMRPGEVQWSTWEQQQHYGQYQPQPPGGGRAPWATPGSHAWR